MVILLQPEFSLPIKILPSVCHCRKSIQFDLLKLYIFCANNMFVTMTLRRKSRLGLNYLVYWRQVVPHASYIPPQTFANYMAGITLSFMDLERGGFGVIIPKMMTEDNIPPNSPSCERNLIMQVLFTFKHSYLSMKFAERHS